jgi:translation initiation factor IF-3
MAGMTGTAKTEEEEFRKIYNMRVVCVPTNRPILRYDAIDYVYAHKGPKLAALVKEVKIRYKIDTHDYLVRIKNIRKFIAQGNKVKVVVMLRGREMQHSSLAFELANRFIEDLKDDPITIEKKPMLEGRNVTMYLAPQA